LPNGLPDDVRGFAPLESAPGPHAIFASNPERKLHELVDIWISSILPRVPGAVLDVYGLNSLSPGDDAWQLWEGRLLPTGVPAHIQASVRVHPTPDRAGLIEAMRKARVLLYLGHKAEAFCISVAEAQALGVPAVLAPVAVLPERVIDGVTGFVAQPDSAFANAAVRLLTDDVLWRQQHEAALKYQQGIDWAEHAARLELALLGDIGTLGN
jgi:glycosyltransferase involved in cell wall biosynthesis